MANGGYHSEGAETALRGRKADRAFVAGADDTVPDMAIYAWIAHRNERKLRTR